MDRGDDAAAGQLIGGYRIEQVLGRGGMGVVYRAVQPRLQRSVALKVIAPALADDPAFRERFERESTLAAAIDHPHVLPIYEAGEDAGTLYLAMRYVEGSDLAELLRRSGPLSPGRATRLVAQLASALDTAHRADLVHRDVKPANVLVTGEIATEHAYLTDFGLTKRKGSQTGVTGTGQWVGTLDYVAPEQIKGDAVDARADIYALGCLLYELLVGRKPYARDNDAATIWAHVSDPPPRPTAADPTLPTDLDIVITRALAKDPIDRYRSAGDLAAAALAALSSHASAPTDVAAESLPPRFEVRVAAVAPPTGTVTLMFTDIDGWAQLFAALGETYTAVLDDHRRIVRAAVIAAGGVEFDSQGDAVAVAFARADAAVAAAVAIQRRLARHPWPPEATLRVRIGLHTGNPTRVAEGYAGIDVHVANRICAATHGGQVVLSRATKEALDGAAIEGAVLRPLGAQHLRDLDRPYTLFDLAIDAVQSSFPHIRAVGQRPTNLPLKQPEPIGREAELEAARTVLLDGPDRLVTFTGPGGTGKTTLALRLAADVLSNHLDGAFAVLLAQVDDADRVAAAISSALGLREQAGRGVVDVLRDYLAGREILLVLDNFEHVIDAAPVLADLLAAAPTIRMLVTSRVPLRLPGEYEFHVPPLSVSSPNETVLPDAVELFVRQARKVRADFRLVESNRSVVAEICARLDGLPLAIELAAARVRLLTPAAMLARLEHPLELAAGGPRHAPSRQQTLRATIDWSNDLLPRDRQRIFARLGVFAGPFTIEAAKQVCDASLDDLASLLEHSLLITRDDGRHSGRLAMLETIRAYARDRLESSDEHAELRDRHAEWCSEMARAAAPVLLSGAHELLLPRFDAEQDDLRVALDWLASSGRAGAALRLAGDLAIFWDTRGQYIEALARLEGALATADNPPDRDRARALFGLGRTMLITGGHPNASTVLRESLELHRALGDNRGAVLCLSHLGWSRGLEPDGEHDGMMLTEESLTLARSGGDPWTIAVALNNLAYLIRQDDAVRTRALLDECLQLRRRIGEKRTLAITLGNCAELAIADDRMSEAATLLHEALSLAIDLKFDMIIAESRQLLARLAYAQGDLDQAESLLADTVERSERMGDPIGRGVGLFGLSRIATARGNTEQADHLRDTAEQMLSETAITLTSFDRWEEQQST